MNKTSKIEYNINNTLMSRKDDNFEDKNYVYYINYNQKKRDYTSFLFFSIYLIYFSNCIFHYIVFIFILPKIIFF